MEKIDRFVKCLEFLQPEFNPFALFNEMQIYVQNKNKYSKK